MPRIEPLTRANASPDALATLDAVQEKMGRVPNLCATFAHSPAVLTAYLAMDEALGKGQLGAQQRAMIALTVGQTNQSQYCVAANTVTGALAGLTGGAIRQARDGQSEDELNHSLTQLAQKIVDQRGFISDEEFSQLRHRGISDALLVEVIAQVALNTLTNYTDHIAQITIDFPVVGL